jgi:hypothetical protein
MDRCQPCHMLANIHIAHFIVLEGANCHACMISLTIRQNVVSIEESIILASTNLGLELYNIVVATQIVGLDGHFVNSSS